MTHQICIEQKAEHNHEQMFGKLLTNQNICSIIILANKKTARATNGTAIPRTSCFQTESYNKQVAIRQFHFTYFIQHCQSLGNYW